MFRNIVEKTALILLSLVIALFLLAGAFLVFVFVVAVFVIATPVFLGLNAWYWGVDVWRRYR